MHRFGSGSRSTARPPGSAAEESEGPQSGAQPVQISRFVRETLEAYASEATADDVLRRALGRAGLDALPREAARLAAWIDAELHEVARETLGAEEALAVHDRLRPLVQIVAHIEATGAPAASAATTGTKSTGDRFAGEDRTPTLEIALRPFSVVLIAGREPDVAAQLRGCVDSRTAVIPVESGAVLLRDLRLLRQQARMLIVDLRRPHALVDAIRGEAALLERASVLLWGAARDEEAAFRSAFPDARIVRCGPEASVEDLAAVVRMGTTG